MLAVPELSLLVAHSGLQWKEVWWHRMPPGTVVWLDVLLVWGRLGDGGAAGVMLLRHTSTAHLLLASVTYCLYLHQGGVWGLLGVHSVKERGLADKLQPGSPEC